MYINVESGIAALYSFRKCEAASHEMEYHMASRAAAQTGSNSIAIIGAGFSGTLFALKLSQARPELRIYLIERNLRHGRGLAYGACADYHLLNVPIPRMEVGLTPNFTDWLKKRPQQLAEAMQESGGARGADWTGAVKQLLLSGHSVAALAADM